jgi:hypothetical protein
LPCCSSCDKVGYGLPRKALASSENMGLIAAGSSRLAGKWENDEEEEEER